VLQTRLRVPDGAVAWYWLWPHFRQLDQARLDPLPPAQPEDPYVEPVHAERHVLQPRLRELVGDVDWYWLLPH
jgi:hypothetical protein